MAGIYNATAQAKDAQNKRSLSSSYSPSNMDVEKPGKINNACLPDVNTLIAAGINPKTGLPLKMGSPCGSGPYKEAIKKNLRILDEQDAVNRYKWYNLPCSITSQELERMLYYKGQLAFFYIPDANEFYFMPYALDGGIDFYGRFNSVHPVPFAEGTSDEEKKRFAQQRNYLSTLKLKCVYDEEEVVEDVNKSCVLLHDYTKQLSQTVIPRQQLQEGVIDIMSDCIPFMRTALLNATGIQGMRVNSEDEQSNVNAASALINRAALNGEKYVAIVGNMEFQDLTGGEVAKSEEFLLAMQALDNFRLSTYGIENGGLFEKKAHTLESEQQMNTGNDGLVYNDGLFIRQHFCDIVNKLWNLDIRCESTEQATGAEINSESDNQRMSSILSKEDTEEEQSMEESE